MKEILTVSILTGIIAGYIMMNFLTWNTILPTPISLNGIKSLCRNVSIYRQLNTTVPFYQRSY